MIRKLCYYGNPILRKKCRPVETFNAEIKQLAIDLVESMIAHNGSGLAAPQIGVDLRMFAVCTSDENDDEGFPLEAEPKVFINPKIIRISEKKTKEGEGCLSIPGLYEKILRPVEIDIEAYDPDGNLFQELGLKQWRARAIQHENDHLDGILTIDYYSSHLKEKYKHQLLVMEKQYLDQTLMSKDIFF